MKKEQLVQNLQRKISLLKRLGMSYHFQLRAVLGILLGVSCWTAVVWLVWNHALTNLLNFGGIGPVLSLVLGTFLHAISKVLEDQESRTDRRSEPGESSVNVQGRSFVGLDEFDSRRP